MTVKDWRICLLAIPNQISTTPMHTSSLGKISWYLLKLSSGNENKKQMDVRQMEGHTDNQYYTLIPCHYRVVGYTKENSNNIFTLMTGTDRAEQTV